MWIYGVVVIAVALVAVGVWYARYRASGRTPPPERDERTPPPDERPREWDPRARYDDDEPPAAR